MRIIDLMVCFKHGWTLLTPPAPFVFPHVAAQEAMKRTRRLAATVIDTMGREIMIKGQVRTDCSCAQHQLPAAVCAADMCTMLVCALRSCHPLDPSRPCLVLVPHAQQCPYAHVLHYAHVLALSIVTSWKIQQRQRSLPAEASTLHLLPACCCTQWEVNSQGYPWVLGKNSVVAGQVSQMDVRAGHNSMGAGQEQRC